MKTIGKYSRVVIPVVLSLVVMSCALFTPTGRVSPTDQVNTIVASTFEAMTTPLEPTSLITETFTPTTLPTTAVPPTPIPPTPVPPTPIPPTPIPPTPAPPTRIPPTAAPRATRLNFATGATFGTTQGNLQPGQSQTFVLGAMKGQPMMVMVDSYYHDFTLAISGKDGTLLLPAPQLQASWQGLLPSTQDYYLQVFSGPGGGNFTLSVTIASRIQFAPGAISASINGFTANSYNVTYALRASAGQVMTINLIAPSGSAALTVYGFTDGQPYVRAQSGQTTFSMVLPLTQDYIIEVVPFAGQEVIFSLQTEVR
jgi:hypothetical protein